MAPRTLPGLGLKAGAPLYETGWNTWTDDNWRIVSALIMGRAISVSTTLPGSPSDGDIYLVPSGAGSHPNEIAIRDAGAWVYVVPVAGWRFYISDVQLMFEYNGTIWTPLPIRLFPAETVTPPLNGEMTFELTSNTLLTVKVKGSDGTVRSATLTLS